jgi:hypothetical protein
MAEQPYAPENEIPSSFWQLIEAANRDPEKLRATLRTLDRAVIADVFKTYVYARADLRGVFEERDETQESTEDTLDDLADSIVAMGREAYLNAYYQRDDLPDDDTWESLPTFVHVFDQVFYERFGGNIFDEIEP